MDAGRRASSAQEGLMGPCGGRVHERRKETKMRRTMLLAGLAVLALVLGRTAQAADPKDGDRDRNDDHFVKMATSSGLAEVNLGNVAVRLASNPGVRAFAQQMVTDHTLANTELLGILNKKGLAAARTMGAEHQKKEKQLLKLTGAQFDREYMACMVKDHEDAVKLFGDESKNGRDADLKGFATKTLPILRHHLDMAKRLAGETGARHDRDRDEDRDRDRKDDHKDRDKKDDHKDRDKKD